MLRLFPCFLLLLAGCGPSGRAPEAGSPQAARPGVTERAWSLVRLGRRRLPLGTNDRPPTLQLDAATGRATGFAGCNRYGAAFVLRGDSLHFGRAVVSRMSCGPFDELERAFLAALDSTRSFTAQDSQLVLQGAAGALAEFEPGGVTVP